MRMESLIIFTEVVEKWGDIFAFLYQFDSRKKYSKEYHFYSSERL